MQNEAWLETHTVGWPQLRERLADYLIALGELGVAGFRIDAAKHIQPVELDSIIDLVNQAATTRGDAVPYVFGEVIDYGGEAVRIRYDWIDPNLLDTPERVVG